VAAITAKQVELIRESFRLLVPIVREAAAMFYDRLFTVAPETRALFKPDIAAQREKLAQMLLWVVANLDRPETLVPAVAELGRRHTGYDVEPEHYDQVGAALIWTLELGLGAAFTAETRQAWLDAYAVLADAMLAGAEAPPFARDFAAQLFEGAGMAAYGAIVWTADAEPAGDPAETQQTDAPQGIRDTVWWR
jgi:hemoglobin-like flavoprotein